MNKKQTVTYNFTVKVCVLDAKVKNGEIYINLEINGRSKWIKFSTCTNFASDVR